MHCEGCGSHGHKAACKGSMIAVAGALLIANQWAAVNSGYSSYHVDWWFLFGGLLILKGLVIIILGGKCMCHHSCCGDEEMGEKEAPMKEPAKNKKH